MSRNTSSGRKRKGLVLVDLFPNPTVTINSSKPKKPRPNRKPSRKPKPTIIEGCVIAHSERKNAPVLYENLGDLTITGYKVVPLRNPAKVQDIQEKGFKNQVIINTKKEASHPKLKKKCLDNEITVLRGVCEHTGFNLDLFSSDAIIKANPNQNIEVRVQQRQERGINLNEKGFEVWPYQSDKKSAILSQHAKYQTNPQNKDYTKILFGTNIDCSGESWAAQIKELKKLPSWLQVNGKNDMLNFVNHELLGVNTVQLYMKVAGNRTPAHNENNNICSININIGPGDCEWFAVPYSYWGFLYDLCKKNGVDYSYDSWWPSLKDLEKNGIPYERFIQKKGDLVFISYGCVHWVEALDTCNNIAWNTAPMTQKQYQVAIERYEWNKTQKYESVLPMLHLSWRMASLLKTCDKGLHSIIRSTLERSLRLSVRLMEFVHGLDMQVSERVEGDSLPPKCIKCQVEVFGFVFVLTESPGTPVIPYCLKCAHRKSGGALKNFGFTCVQDYSLAFLINSYDRFSRLRIPKLKVIQPEEAES